jgi:hypothetical protein
MIRHTKNRLKAIFINKNSSRKIILAMKTKEMDIMIKKMTINEREYNQDHSKIDI